MSMRQLLSAVSLSLCTIVASAGVDRFDRTRGITYERDKAGTCLAIDQNDGGRIVGVAECSPKVLTSIRARDAMKKELQECWNSVKDHLPDSKNTLHPMSTIYGTEPNSPLRWCDKLKARYLSM